MPKTIPQIESDIIYGRNALARRKLTADESQDPASLLLWQAALDTAELLAGTVKGLAEEVSLYRQALVQESEGRQDALRGREALEAENSRLSREIQRLHQALLDVSPRDYHMFRQSENPV